MPPFTADILNHREKGGKNESIPLWENHVFFIDFAIISFPLIRLNKMLYLSPEFDLGNYNPVWEQNKFLSSIGLKRVTLA